MAQTPRLRLAAIENYSDIRLIQDLTYAFNDAPVARMGECAILVLLFFVLGLRGNGLQLPVAYQLTLLRKDSCCMSCTRLGKR